ncbi:hypothetical protein lbkm_1042 [Lachnospiraceae bacterium KM106-2]|nr:hypothetical protein lbkm_1042 [Lachnospiraceae bacterium KM106-2]
MSNKNRYFILVTILACLVVFFCFTRPVFASNSPKDSKRAFRIANVEVKEGDSLWNLAKEYYTDDYENMDHYIDEIKECNSMIDDKIYSGGYIVIPYYIH